MQLLCDACPLGEPLLETDVHLPLEMVHAKTIQRHDHQGAHGRTQSLKPASLPECWLNYKGNSCLRAIPQTFAAGCDDVEPVGTWAQMAVVSLPRCDNVAPSLIVALKLISEPVEFRRRKTGTCEVEIDVLTAGSELE